MTRRILLILALLLAPAAAIAESLTGSYRAIGRYPDGTAYTGTVRIEDDGASIRVMWAIGTRSYLGAGPRDGRVITVDWGDATPIVYVVMDDGELHGTWADGTAHEKLIPY